MGLQDPHPFNYVDPNDKNSQIDIGTLLFRAIVPLAFFLTGVSLGFLCDYIRRRRRQSAAANHPLSRPSGLDKAAINCLPIVSNGSSGLSSGSCVVGECSICLGELRDGEKVKVLPLCHHGFHSECVNKWLRTRSSCPLCRASVVRDDSLAQSDVP